MLDAWPGSDKYNLLSHWFDSTRFRTRAFECHDLPKWEKDAQLVQLWRLVANWGGVLLGSRRVIHGQDNHPSNRRYIPVTHTSHTYHSHTRHTHVTHTINIKKRHTTHVTIHTPHTTHVTPHTSHTTHISDHTTYFTTHT